MTDDRLLPPTMKYLDELFLLYPGKDPLTQRFILSQALAAEDDSGPDAVALLRQELASPHPSVARTARHVLGATLSRYTQVTCALTPPKPEVDLTGVKEAGRLVAAAAPYLVEPLRRVFDRLTAPRTDIAYAASLTLGRLWTGGLVARLSDLARHAPGSLAATASLAEIGTAPAREAVADAIERHGLACPDLFMCIAGLTAAPALSLVAAAEGATDAYGRSCLALALAGLPGDQTRPLLERLIRRREGWVTACALDALAVSGAPEDFPLVKLAWDLETHEFLRVQALRAAGSIASGEARDFLVAGLGQRSARLQAVALEALAQTDLPASELAAYARPLVGSDLVRCRVQAVLSCAREDPGVAEAALGWLLLSPEPLLRLEGAYLLGFLKGAGSAELLSGMSCEDPSAAVRRQAIQSLGRYRADDAVARLAPLLDSPDPGLVTDVARALVSAAGRATAARLLGAALSKSPTGASRGALLAMLGVACAPAAAVPEVMVAALASADPDEQRGALSGLIAAGGAIPKDAVAPLATSPDCTVRARACLAAFLAGDLERIAGLTELVGSDEGEAAPAAMNALLDLGLLLPLSVGNGRYPGMVARLAPVRAAAGEAVASRSDVSQVSIKLDGLWKPPPTRRKTGLAPVIAAVETDRPLEPAGVESLRSRYRKTAARLAALPQPLPGSPGALGQLFLRLSRLRDSGIFTLPAVLDLSPNFDISLHVELTSPRAWLSRAPRAALAAALLALTGAVYFLWPAASGPDSSAQKSRQASLQSTLLRVGPRPERAFVKSRRGQPEPALAGTPVNAGDEVWTATGGSLTLVDVAGDVVTLAGDSALAIAGADRGSTRFRVSYRFERAAGRLMLDFHAQPDVKIQVGTTTLALAFARAEAAFTSGLAHGRLLDGSAVIQRPGSPAAKLARGAAITLP